MSIVLTWRNDNPAGTYNGATAISDPNTAVAGTQWVADPNVENGFIAVFDAAALLGGMGFLDLNTALSSLGRDLDQLKTGRARIRPKAIAHQRNHGLLLDDFLIGQVVIKYDAVTPIEPVLSRVQFSTTSGVFEILDSWTLQRTFSDSGWMATCALGGPIIVHNGEQITFTDGAEPANVREISFTVIPMSEPTAYMTACLAEITGV